MKHSMKRRTLGTARAARHLTLLGGLPAVLTSILLSAGLLHPFPAVAHSRAQDWDDWVFTLNDTRPGGWIGISITSQWETVPPGTEVRRVVVAAVDSRGPAARAGVVAGMRIVSLGGLEDSDELLSPGLGRKLDMEVGDVVELVVMDRDDQIREFQLVAQARPASFRTLWAPNVVPIDSVARRLYGTMDTVFALFSKAITDPLRMMADTLLPTLLAFSDSAGPVLTQRLAFLRDSLADERSELRAAADSLLSLAADSLVALAPLAPYRIGRDRLAGARFADVGPALGSYFGVEEGALVLDSPTDTPAWQAGLRAGDVVTGLNGRPVTSASSLRALLRNRPAVLAVIRNGEGLEITIFR